MKTLDLHGNDYTTATRKIESFIYNNPPPVKIITGKSTEMRKIVLDIIEKYGYYYHYERLINEGCLVITEQGM